MKLQCPHCKTSFQVDENDYAAILAQVKTAEFENEVQRRLSELERQHKAEEKARELKVEKETERKLADKDREKGELEREIERLKGEISNFEAHKRVELADMASKNERKFNDLEAEKDKEILELKAKLLMADKQRELDIVNTKNSCRDELHQREQAITELNSQLKAQEVAAKNKELELNERHKALLKAKDEEIEHYKDMKSRLSTKLLGETLERHCQNMFNRARAYGQFQGAYFEKDNDASGGTKGDFIFRDYVDGDEYLSIMFEMKNEDDLTATKHRNEDFFAKLDKDRREKNCEYAVLVSMLETDSELYNEGIVDVSFRYEKMYVVRPQFFLAVISMLSRAARRGAERLIGLRRELEVAKAQSIDVTKFEQRRDKFVADFSKLVEGHLKKQDEALIALDKAIEAAEKQAENLRKIKSTFEMSKGKLIKANEKVENDFTIKKLTYGNATMRSKFEEARKLNAEIDNSELDELD